MKLLSVKTEFFIRRVANSLGLDVTRYRPWRTQSGTLGQMLRHHQIDLVVDVGANTGQFATQLRGVGYKKWIYSIEPLSQAHALLKAHSAKDPLWIIADRAAAGSAESTASIKIAKNSVSSSLLPMLDSHLEVAPDSAYCASEEVRVIPLDSLYDAFPSHSRLFIKIDSQGYELQVLGGAQRCLRDSLGVQIEVSLVQLYDGSGTFHDIVSIFQGAGFELWSVWPVLTNHLTGRTLQADLVFFKRSN